MKLTSFVWRSLVGVACMGLVLGTAAGAEKKSASKIKSKESSTQSRTQSAALKPRVILVQVTGSWIPQRVVVYGQQANSASPQRWSHCVRHARSGSEYHSALVAGPVVRYGIGRIGGARLLKPCAQGSSMPSNEGSWGRVVRFIF